MARYVIRRNLNCPRSLMDKVTVFETVDVGSIPTEGTCLNLIFALKIDKITKFMVVVAQLAELSVVVRAVVGSNPIDHPI